MASQSDYSSQSRQSRSSMSASATPAAPSPPPVQNPPRGGVMHMGRDIWSFPQLGPLPPHSSIPAPSRARQNQRSANPQGRPDNVSEDTPQAQHVPAQDPQDPQDPVEVIDLTGSDDADTSHSIPRPFAWMPPRPLLTGSRLDAIQSAGRLPRHTREIIDLENAENNEQRGNFHNQSFPPGEVQTPIELLSDASSGSDISDESNEIEVIFERPRAFLPSQHNTTNPHHTTNPGQRQQRNQPQPPQLPLPQQQINTAHRTLPPPGHIRGFMHHLHQVFTVPPQTLRYDVPAFNLGNFGRGMNLFNVVGGPRSPPAPVPTTFGDLPPARDDFTRTPPEDPSTEEEIVCPNCGNELCTEKDADDDGKSSVWVVKVCGHAYCGDCATNRTMTRRKKDKAPFASAKTKAFTHCVVEDCGKPTKSATAMVQLFL